MHDLNRIVVPQVSAQWEDIAYALQYDIPTVENISVRCKENPTKCSKELFKNWLATNSGAKPKIWQTLIYKLKEIEELCGVTEIIEVLIQMDAQAGSQFHYNIIIPNIFDLLNMHSSCT